MFTVYLLSHGGVLLSFQSPWRFAGCPPAARRDQEIASVIEEHGVESRIRNLLGSQHAPIGRDV